MVVYPGVIDTELFTLPDNDVPDLPVAAEPVSVAVDAVLAGLDVGAAQVFVPEWFHGVTANKEKDVARPSRGQRPTSGTRSRRSRSRRPEEVDVKIEPDAAGMRADRLERITEHFGAHYVDTGKIVGCQITVVRGGTRRTSARSV